MLGISPDPVSKLAEFRQKENLPFSLLSDTSREALEQYGVWVEKSMYGRKYMGVERTSFIIGPDGRIEKIFPKVKPATHSEQVLAALAEL
ncbi:MAG: hypothetical protein Kow0031_19110 [Anaerolineae bacterium]